MSKCIKCNVTMFDEMLHRTQPKGQDPDWMCMSCIERHEPELASNIKGDDNFGVKQIISDHQKSL